MSTERTPGLNRGSLTISDDFNSSLELREPDRSQLDLLRDHVHDLRSAKHRAEDSRELASWHINNQRIVDAIDVACWCGYEVDVTDGRPISIKPLVGADNAH